MLVGPCPAASFTMMTGARTPNLSRNRADLLGHSALSRIDGVIGKVTGVRVRIVCISHLDYIVYRVQLQ